MATTQDWLEATPSEWEAMYQAATELPSEGKVLALLDDGADLPLWLSARRDIGPPGSVPVGMEGYLELIERRVAETKRLPELVRTVREGVGDLRECELEALQAAVRDVAVGAPLVGVVVAVVDDPADRLVAALLCIWSLPRAAGHQRAVLAMSGAVASRELGFGPLLPLSKSLFQLVVAESRSARMTVEALLALAVLEPVLDREHAHGSAHEESLRLLERARLIASEHCEPTLWANVVSLWVRQRSLVGVRDAAAHAARRQELLGALDEAQEKANDRVVLAKLLRARATLVAQSGPDGTRGDHGAAVPLLEQALELAPEVDGWWLDTVRELAALLLLVGRREAAVEWLQRCLDVGGDLQSPEDTAWVLQELSRAHEQLGDSVEAERHSRGADRLAGSSMERLLFRVRRVVDLGNAARAREALALAGRLRPDLHRLQPNHQIDYWQTVMVCEIQELEWDAAREAYEAASKLAQRSGRKVVLDLLWARFMSGRDESIQALLSYASGELGPMSQEADRLARRMVEDLRDSLTASQRGVLTRWAMMLDVPANAVSVFVALGDEASARATIAFALGSASPDERLSLLCYRVLLEPNAPLDERRAWAKEALATAAELDDLDFEGLYNLAQTCALVADDDRTWWAKALEIWPRAWAQASDLLQQRQAAGRWLEPLYEWERLSRDGGRTGLGAFLQVFRPAASHLSEEGLHHLREVVANALRFGALTHPRVLDEVEAIADLFPDALEDVLLRALSIRQAHQRPNVGISVVEGGFGLQEFPQPIIDAALGHPVETIPSKLVEDLNAWGAVCRLRPDLTDTTLAAGLRATRALSASLQATWMQFAHAMVQQGDWGGTVWHQLPPLVMSFPPETPGRSALLLTLQRAGADVQPGDLPIVGHDAAFERAVAKMDRIRRNPQDPEAATLKAEAIAELEALVTTRSGLLAVDVRISLANALRLPPEPDLDGAIEVYRSISQDDLLDEQHGKLHKVWADALRHRAADGDLAEAWTHLDLALKLRKGRVLAETHLSAVWLALVDDSLPSEEQARRAGSHLVQCVELAPEMMRPFQQEVLAAVRRWARDAPKTLDRAAVRRTLVSAWPEAGARIDESLAGLSRSVTESQMFPLHDHMVQLLSHPAMRAYMQLTEGLAGVHDQQVQLAMMNELAAKVGKAAPPQVNIWNDADAIRARLALVPAGTPEERPGRAVAEVVLRARLVRLGVGLSDTLRPLTERARSTVD